ncbi:NAD-dependent epimerase/dehydratase family protein [Actinomadura sp. KC345]|uniref:NAD-dependent epimerase/dehydratase family protein n=1 Tax=Actinomadura sp. KC345 TaxID=2530371 RepID=UPI0010490F46|nr:NAD-dependent epimerase/dehydratase family protein [Actinomadura sp. KC345]TDC44513.1 NAD-dependent epimerase/dehydratase family protein [Actinomadura sp. KC345]
MEIIGSGFMARHLRPLHDAHPQYTVLAAGVPRQQLPDSEHEREARLVRDAVEHCRRQDRRLVFFSTASMYGSPGCRGREDAPVVPSNRYGRHKLDLESAIRGSGVRHLILRLGYVLGPHGPDFRLIPSMIRQIRAGRVRIYRGARRDILHVSDFVAILDRLLSAKISEEVVNVASGDCADVAGMVAHIERCLGVTAEHLVVGEEHTSHCPSTEKLRTLLPEVAFEPGYHRRAIERYLAETE